MDVTVEEKRLMSRALNGNEGSEETLKMLYIIARTTLTLIYNNTIFVFLIIKLDRTQNDTVSMNG